jgi:hypothetical protein
VNSFFFWYIFNELQEHRGLTARTTTRRRGTEEVTEVTRPSREQFGAYALPYTARVHSHTRSASRTRPAHQIPWPVGVSELGTVLVKPHFARFIGIHRQKYYNDAYAYG